MYIPGLSPAVLTSFINFLASLIEGLLMLRVTLKLFGASTAAPFVTWIFETTEPLLTPFTGMFPSPQLTDGFVIEFSALFALMFYAFVAYIITELILSLKHYGSQRENDRAKK